MHRKTVLLLNYHYPPLGGSGVQRALKFSKYLPVAGWDTIVLTVKSVYYLVYDHSLLKEIPPEVEVIRTESLDPQRLSAFLFPKAMPKAEGNNGVVRNTRMREGSRALMLYRCARDWFSLPDIWIGWLPFAVIAGVKAVRRRKADAIVGMLGAGSTAPITRLISSFSGVPYVLDLRDGWTEDPNATYPTRFHKRVNEILEKWSMTKVSALTVYGEVCRERFERKYPWLEGKVTVLPNGFDPADMHDIVPQPRSLTKRRIVYMGSLNFYHEANFIAFLDALKLLPAEVRGKLEVIFVGRAYTRAPDQVERAGLNDVIQFIPYCRHGEALGHLQSADAALLFVAAWDQQSLTGKVFEYLMVGRPILACIAPESGCADLLRNAGTGQWIVPADDPHSIANGICALDAEGWPVPDKSRVDQYSRKRGAEKLAGILDEVIGKPVGEPALENV